MDSKDITSAELTRLQNEEVDLERCLHATRIQIRDEELRLADGCWGLRVGSIVRHRNGKEYRVDHIISAAGYFGPVVRATRRNKDGGFGGAQAKLYSGFEVIGYDGEEK